MKVLVTGGGGFVGLHLVKTLKERGYEVYSFSRNHHPELDAMGVTTRAGNLRSDEDVLKASEGMDAIFHVASRVGMWGKYDDFFQTNVIGTQNIIHACRKHGIEKLVYTSSPSVAFGTEDLKNVDESHPYPTEYLSPYGKTKGIAEQHVLKANDDILATVSIRPHLIFGPGDNHLFPRVVERARQGKARRIGDGTNLIDVTFVGNVVDAHVQAFDHLDIGSQVAGKAYFIGQEEPVNLWEFVDEILSRHQLPALDKSMSLKKAYRIGVVLERIYLLLGKSQDPPMTRFIAKQLACHHYFDHSAAKNDFGYHPKVSIKEALDITIPND